MSKQPSPPPPGDKPAPTAPPPAPPWRHWLWPIALLTMLVLYFFLPGFKSTSAQLSYSQFLSNASAHKIKTVTFGSSSNGGNTPASGTLSSGGTYTTVIPGPASPALSNQLLGDGVKTVNASPSTPSFAAQLFSWLILLAPLIFVFWLF